MHKDREGNYNIVDGQQRLVTLSILIYCIEELENKDFSNPLLQEKFNKLSRKALLSTYNLFKKRLKSKKQDRVDAYFNYILESLLS